MTTLAGCSTVDLVNARLFGARAPDVADAPYAPGPRHTFDLYRPAGSGPAPIVVFIYGGGWDSGDKEMYRFVGSALAAHGFLTIIPDYRIFPDVLYPDFIADAAAAVAFVRAHAAALGGDADRIALLGHSAGAYIAAMLALDGRWLGAHGLDPARDLRAVVGLSGPYDFLPLHSEELMTIFGPPETRVQTQPITYVTGRAPPLLLAAGEDDTTVDPANSARLAAKIDAAGGSVRLVLYPRLAHRIAIGAFAPPLRPFFAPVFADSVAFLDAHLTLPVPAEGAPTN